MKIRTKLLLGLSTLPILLIILVSIGWSQLSNLHKMSNSLQTNYDLTILAEQIQRDIKNQGIHIRNLVIYKDKDTLQNELNNLQLESDSLTQNIALLESKLNTKEQHKFISKLKSTNQEFNVYKDQLVKLTLEGKKEEAIALISKRSVSIHDQFSQVISDITTTLEANMQSYTQTILKDYQQKIIIGAVLLAVCIILIMSFLFKIARTLVQRLNKVSTVMRNVANGSANLSTKVQVIANDEIDDVANSFNQMVESLEEQMKKEQELTWAKSNIAEITTSLSGKNDLDSLSQTFLSKVVPLVESSHAVFYVKDVVDQQSEPVFKLLASYAFKERKHFSNTIRFGEGLIGQAALEKAPIILTDVPSDYIRITSGLGEATPLNLYVLPICFEGDVKAVLELASFKPYNAKQQKFLEDLINSLGIILESVMGRIKLAKLLEESQTLMEEIQAQSEELQSQQEELKSTNEELEEQTQALRQSEEKLQAQQEELEQTNADLEEKAKSLEEQNKRFERTNKEVEKARAELEEKAKLLALSSKYKSEFLANMSHELRTPLNSLLILSKLLADNMDGNLTSKQVEYSRTIYSSGNDLLELINEILDLAKIESGKMEVNPSNVRLTDIAEFVENSFRPIANEKNLVFNVVLNDNLPRYIYSDQVRLQQVLRNLLSNAFKFTLEGEVRLEISLDSQSSKQSVLSFSVIDTGIGIPIEKRELIFQAFQQADGTTSRKYGGTGLGLSISREIATLLGGRIVVNSEKENRGSTFTFYVGDYLGTTEEETIMSLDETAVSIENIKEKPNRVLTEGIPFKIKQSPNIAENGHIKRLLVVDDDLKQRNSLMELIGDMDVIMKAVSSGQEAIEELKVSQFDCMILDLGLSDTTGFDLLEKIKLDDKTGNVKVFVYTGRDLSSKEEIYLNKYAHTIIIKDKHSPQRLKDELELYLNGWKDQSEVLDKLDHEQVKNLTVLEGKKILLVDDDVRNVYALSSILEIYGIEVKFAENGVEALEIIKKNSDFDLILMDIMMPEMDGYETMQILRDMPAFSNLPIIALTAKAMKEDREKCMESGASDYIVKPVDPDQLLSLIKVWLYQ